MNTAVCASTGYTSAYLTFGRELRTPDEAQRDLRALVQSENFVPEITPKLALLADTLREARETHEVQQDKRKKTADKHRRPPSAFKVGDKVMVTTHILSNAGKGISAKLSPRRDGPYVITEKVGPVSYRVALAADSDPLGIYHVSALEPFKGDESTTPMAPIKRRGRPKKQQKTNTEGSAQTASTAGQPKRGRGHPRK